MNGTFKKLLILLIFFVNVLKELKNKIPKSFQAPPTPNSVSLTVLWIFHTLFSIS